MYLREISLLTATTLAAFTITATPSHAADDPPTARVSYADLSLDTQAGARAFGLRLHAAATRVCGQPVLGSRIRSTEEVRCQRTAIRNAKRELEQRRLAIDPTAWTIASR